MPGLDNNKPALKVYRYRVECQPELPNKRIRHLMMNALLAKITEDNGVVAASNMSDQLLSLQKVPTGKRIIPHPKKVKMDAKKLAEQAKEASSSQAQDQQDQPQTGVDSEKQSATQQPVATQPPASEALSPNDDPAQIGNYDFTFTISELGTEGDDGALDFRHLFSHLTSLGSGVMSNKQEYLAALNILFRRMPSKRDDVLAVGHERLFQTTTAGEDVGWGLNLKTGYFTSFRTVPDRLVLNVNTNRAAFYNPIALDDLIKAFIAKEKSFGDPKPSEVNLEVDLANNHTVRLQRLSRFLQGLIVKTTHLHSSLGEERVATITGLPTTRHRPTVQTEKFRYVSGDGKAAKNTTVRDYFHGNAAVH